MRLGNDIVDCAATRGHHPRFIDRILCLEEKSRRSTWSLDEPLIWLYWACKEAAYKAIRQTQDIPFHHRDFIVSEDFTRLSFHDEVLRIGTRVEGEAILAFATDGDPLCCHSTWAALDLEPLPAVQSEKARSLLLDLAAFHLQRPRAELSIIQDRRIPKIQHQGQTLPHAASLSHHGRYVAASLAVP